MTVGTAVGLSASIDKSWPGFLVGCHRSGTTLARYYLDAHPRIACPPESKFLAGLRACVEYPQAVKALRSFGVPRSELMKRLGGVAREILDQYAAQRGKARWVDKTPNYYKHLDFIDELFESRVFYIFMIRHPLDTVASLEATPYFRDGVVEDPDIANALARYGRSRTGWARYWLEVNAALRAFADLQPGRVCFVTY